MDHTAGERAPATPVRVAARATLAFAALWVIAILVARLAGWVMDSNTDDVAIGLLVGLALLGSTSVGIVVFAHAVWLLQLREAAEPAELPTRRQRLAVGAVGIGSVAGIWAWLSATPVAVAVLATAVVAVLLPGLVAWWLVMPAFAPTRRADP